MFCWNKMRAVNNARQVVMVPCFTAGETVGLNLVTIIIIRS
jgi:hypothetical protein